MWPRKQAPLTGFILFQIKFLHFFLCSKCRVLKKMREEGVLVAGAQPGRKGAGCFKISPEEKSRIADVAKAAAKKLKAQQKQGVGKVRLCWVLG